MCCRHFLSLKIFSIFLGKASFPLKKYKDSCHHFIFHRILLHPISTLWIFMTSSKRRRQERKYTKTKIFTMVRERKAIIIVKNNVCLSHNLWRIFWCKILLLVEERANNRQTTSYRVCTYIGTEKISAFYRCRHKNK